ncbi:MAG: hypothetical protein JNL70_01245 [Saprospiraceae bacterium]|nr:hypothetical protein [Saprospiraceae bacterium]
MTNPFLLSHRFKQVGWYVATASFIGLGLQVFLGFDILPFLKFGKKVWLDMTNDTFSDEVFCILLLVGLLMIAFSAEKVEDERIQRIRLGAFQWAVLTNSVILLLSIILIYDFNFLLVMEYNIFTTLVLLIARFHYLIWRDNKITLDL